jgi:isocitrate/isopropylmalate dehydrogenase
VPPTTPPAIRCRRRPSTLARGRRRGAARRRRRPQVGAAGHLGAPGEGPARPARRAGLFANLRPAILYPQLADASTLKPEVVSGLDILIVRELTGGIYFGQPRGVETLESGERRASTPWSTPSPRSSASAASPSTSRKRGKRVCSVDKANVLECTELWREVATASARLSRHRAEPHVRGQRGHAAGARAEAVRRHGHHQHVRRHPVGLRRACSPAPSACCRRRR